MFPVLEGIPPDFYVREFPGARTTYPGAVAVSLTNRIVYFQHPKGRNFRSSMSDGRRRPFAFHRNGTVRWAAVPDLTDREIEAAGETAAILASVYGRQMKASAVR